MMPTLWGSSVRARGGVTQPRSQAMSAMYFSTAPMVTLSNPFSMTQLPSHRRSCGQMRPQISGRCWWRSDLVGLLQPPFRGELQPVGDVLRERAMHLAEGHAALAAPAGLLGGGGRFELAVDLAEVFAPFADAALLRLRLREADELEHAVGHGRSPGLRASARHAPVRPSAPAGDRPTLCCGAALPDSHDAARLYRRLGQYSVVLLASENKTRYKQPTAQT
jgi:hypothetical protein